MTQLDALAIQLHLSDDQKAKIGTILKDEKASHKVLKKDASVPEEVKPARHREIADQHNSQIRELLDSGPTKHLRPDHGESRDVEKALIRRSALTPADVGGRQPDFSYEGIDELLSIHLSKNA